MNHQNPGYAGIFSLYYIWCVVTNNQNVIFMENLENKRCLWAGERQNDIVYHDTEWGVPVHDDKKLFEFLVLETFQAGLSWTTILNKRENFRDAFDNFNAEKISNYGESKVQELIQNKGIIRNKLKINSTILNARLFLDIQREYRSFDSYIWQFTNGTTIVNQREKMNDIPASTSESEAMSKDLKKRGFKFVGSTICYAFMQATGMVNDHTIDCFRYKEVGDLSA